MYQIFLYPRNVRHFHHPVSKYEIPIRLIDWLIDRLLLCLLCICLLVMNRPPKWSAVPAEESPEKLLRDADRVSAGALSYSFLFVSQFLSFFSFLLSFFFFLWLDFFFLHNAATTPLYQTHLFPLLETRRKGEKEPFFVFV